MITLFSAPDFYCMHYLYYVVEYDSVKYKKVEWFVAVGILLKTVIIITSDLGF